MLKEGSPLPLVTGDHKDFGPEGTPCLSPKLFWAMEFLGSGEGAGCFIRGLSWLPLPPRLALSSVEGRIVPPVLCGLYFTACDSSCWDGRFLVVGFLGQGGPSHCLPGAQHLEAGEAQMVHSTIRSLKGSWRKEQKGKAGEGLSSPRRLCS